MKLCRPTCALALGSVLVLAGCATKPVPPESSLPVRSRGLLPDFALFSRPVHHGARVVIVRDAGKLDATVSAEVIVDGHSVASLRPGERVEVYVFASDHVLGVTSSPGFFAAPLVYRPFTFQAGRTYHLRVGVVGRYLDITPATPPR